MLRRGLAEAPSSLVVKNDNVEGGRPLFDDNPEPPSQPDIVVEADNTSPVVSDVKYKDKPERTDLNQVITYGACYRSKHVFLIYQKPEYGTPRRKHLGRIEGLNVNSYAFDLGSANIEEEEPCYAMQWAVSDVNANDLQT